MKTICTIVLIIISSITYGQGKFALIDTDLKKPIIYTDSVSITQISSNYFPVNVSSFDTLYAQLTYLKGLITGSVKRSKLKSFELRTGLTAIKFEAFKHAYGDAYNVNLITRLPYLTANHEIGNHEALNKKTIRNIGNWLKYMEQEKSLFRHGLFELQPTYHDPTTYN